MASLVDQYRNVLNSFGLDTKKAVFESKSPLVNYIAKWIEYKIEESRKMLDDAGRVASRRLRDGIEPVPVVINDDGTLEFAIRMEAYYDFVNKGVNGQQVNHGSPYSFRDTMPNIPNLLDWMAEKGINKLEYISKAGEYIVKDLVTREDYEGMAYLIKRGLQRKGYEAVPFVDDVFNDKAIDELVLELQKLWQ